MKVAAAHYTFQCLLMAVIDMESVLLVDDHSAIRLGIRQTIEKIGKYEVIAEAENGEQAYELYVKHSPRIIIMDLSMPGAGGIETVRRIQSRKENPRIIIYTMHEEPIHARKAIESGAMGYVLKSEPICDLLNAIEKVDLNHRYLSERVAQKLAIDNVLGSNDPLASLTCREYEVLCFSSKGLSVREIAKLLAISTKTVATYQTSLKQKLNINNPVDLVLASIKAGILKLPE